MALRSFALLAALVSASLAQSTTSPYIPSDISAGCSAFLSSLDSSTTVLDWTASFTSALAAFAPGSSAPSSSSAITSALNSLSGSVNQLSQSTVTTELGNFYAACEAELTSSPNTLVKTIYESLYVLVPTSKALISKDVNGNYCATELANSSSTGSGGQTLLTNYLFSQVSSGSPSRRDSSSSTPALIPNTTTYETTNVLFMLLQPSNVACTACTRSVISSFITFESACPFAPGMNNSLMLAGQSALYSSINNKCGNAFLSGALSDAGGISKGIVSSGATRVVGHEFSGAISIVLSVIAFAAASL